MLTAEARAIEDAEQALEQLKAEACRLQKSLSRDVNPRLAELQREETSLGGRRDGLLSELDGLIANRLEATQVLGNITKRQLSEIKQLTRSPPDAIRRTLIAAWLLLNGERFQGKQTVAFDEAKDWPRCQRMLADEGFIPHILKFELSSLVGVPHVPRYVASHFFGMNVFGERAGGRGGTPELPRIPGVPVATEANATPLSPSTITRSVTEPLVPNCGRGSIAASEELPSAVRRSITSRTISKRAFGSLIEKPPPPPLEVEAVTHASEPCGALLRWMLELLQEYVERERIEKELRQVKADFENVQKLRSQLEGDAAELEARLAKALLAAEEREQAIAKLKLEKESAKKAAQDLAKLEQMQKPKPRPSQQQKKEKAMEIELELSGSMAHLEYAVAQLRVCFSKGFCKVGNGDADQALALPRLADMIKKQKGSKFLLEGHCEPGENEGVDYERCLAVFEWLVDAALCPPNALRIKGRKAACGEGACVVPVLIDELVVRSGPPNPQLEAAGLKHKPGLFFGESSNELSGETRAILGKIASWLSMEDDTYVRIEGHTDASEKTGLDMRRAQAVRDELIGLGVAMNKLKVSPCQSRHPFSRLHPELNRRVELHVD